MSGSPFIPNIKPVQAERTVVQPPKNDDTGNLLMRIAQYAVVGIVAFIPIFFTPGLWASLGFDKFMLTLSLAVIVMVTLSLLALRRNRVETTLPIPLALFWGVVLAALVSALLSGDAQDALRGSVMEPQTVSFLALMALVMTVSMVMQGSKLMSVKAIAAFGVVAGLLLVYNVARIVFGAGFLPLDSFGAVTVSPIGGFNDLAIFAGLTIILGLITLLQLPLRAGLQYSIAAIILLSLFVLSVVNFFNIWIIVGFFALLLFIYLLSRDTLFKSSDSEDTVPPLSRVLVVLTAVVCVFSAIFIVAGEYAGSKLSELTNVNYVEVRPSLPATIDIAGAVYSENVLLGVGPNRFADAWRMHKDRSINETIFWDTDFNAGSGYIPTLFVTLGALGGLLLLTFHIWFLYLGYKTLLRNLNTDSYWYYFAVISFSGAIFLWAMSYIYVPGSGILLLTALFTGFSFVGYGMNVVGARKVIPLAVNRQRGFLLMAAVIVLITASVATLFSVGEQYVAQARFTESRATAQSVEEFEQVALSSFGLYQDDRFVSARAQIQLATLNALVGIPEPTEDDQRQFLASAEQALIFAEQAVAEDPTNPDNYAVLAGVYSNLAAAGIGDAQARAEQAIAAAQDLDPLNPGYKLMSAQMSVRIGDVPAARQYISEALNLKRNFTQALFLSAQLDIAEGNVESAISTTRAIITLEPNNPTRYFQLGLLLSAANQVEEAIAAYQAAIRLDANYANARYLLALAYLNQGQNDAALTELRFVQQTNQDNTQLQSLIQQVEGGTFDVPTDFGLDAPVSETEPVEGFEDAVTTDGATDTDLVTPVNTVSDSDPEAPDVNVDEILSPESGTTEDTSAE